MGVGGGWGGGFRVVGGGHNSAHTPYIHGAGWGEVGGGFGVVALKITSRKSKRSHPSGQCVQSHNIHDI